MAQPPSTLISWPVMKDASSLARNATTPAMSPACLPAFLFPVDYELVNETVGSPGSSIIRFRGEGIPRRSAPKCVMRFPPKYGS